MRKAGIYIYKMRIATALWLGCFRVRNKCAKYLACRRHLRNLTGDDGGGGGDDDGVSGDGGGGTAWTRDRQRTNPPAAEATKMCDSVALSHSAPMFPPTGSAWLPLKSFSPPEAA